MILRWCVWEASSSNSGRLAGTWGRAWVSARGCHGAHGYHGLLKTQAWSNADTTG